MTKYEEFYHYNLDPKRIKREKKYFIAFVVAAVLFILFVKACYLNFPTSKIVGIPVFNLLVWGIIIGHYLLFTVYLGNKMYDIKGEKDKGLL